MRSTPRQDSDDEKRLMRAEARAQRKGKAAEAEERHVHDDPITMVKKRKLRWYGHISRSSGKAKTVLPGTVKGARRRGRQKKRWEDNIKEWTGMEFGDSLIDKWI